MENRRGQTAAHDESGDTPPHRIIEFSNDDLERAGNCFRDFILDSDIPNEMMRIKSHVLIEQLQKRGLSQALAQKLIEDLVAKKVFIRGQEYVTLRIFTPLSGGPQTDEVLHRYCFLYFTRRRLRKFFTDRKNTEYQETEKAESKGKPELEFRKHGDYWLLRYQNRETSVKDARGMHYIRRLLQKPMQSFPAIWLVAEESGINEMALSGALDEILDERAVKELGQRYSDLENELEDAVECNDLSRQEDLQLEMAQIQAEVSSATGRFGNKHFLEEREKARKSVYNAVKRSIDNISEEHAQLGLHLENSISTGESLRYAPEDNLDWET